MSRSEFFARAADRYLAELDAASLTARIDAALEAGRDEQTEAAVLQAGRRALAADHDEW